MIRFEVEANARPVAISIEEIVEKMNKDDINDIDNCCIGITLNTQETNIIGSSFDMNSVDLVIDPVRNEISVQEWQQDDDGELEIKYIPFTADDEDVKKLLFMEKIIDKCVFARA